MQFMNFKNLIVMNKQSLLDLNWYKIYFLPQGSKIVHVRSYLWVEVL